MQLWSYDLGPFVQLDASNTIKVTQKFQMLYYNVLVNFT